MTGATARYIYAELRDQVARFAGALRGLGRGDRVVIYMPMVPQAVIAMLACARLGAVHSVVFGGFAPRELAARIEEAAPKVLVCASCGIEPSRVAECAVIGVRDSLKGQVPRGFVVLKAGVDIAPETLQAELVAAVRRDIGPIAALKEVTIRRE
ncbi:AMP-binding protein [Microbispora rosea]|uniref:AMP-binding protein n=1 Tax=Microbispora rosea TaxID=58117 RepID=UPI0036B146DA